MYKLNKQCRICLHVLIYIFFIKCTFAQIAIDGMPFGTSVLKRAEIPKYVISSNNLSLNSSSANDNGPLLFAYDFDVNIDLNEIALWETLPNGSRIGRLQIISSGAYSINVIFSNFKVPKHSKLFLYNPQMDDIKGAYSFQNNKDNGVFAISPVKGDTLCIEYIEPADVAFKGILVIDKVNHAFLDVFKNEEENDTISGSCNIDINCSEASDWQKEKRAVCKIIYNGSKLCTGTLINNSNNDQTPYIITAHHCIHNESVANTAVFIFNYENSTCGEWGIQYDHSISGASLVATDPFGELDFSLLHLSVKPPEAWNLYFVGWHILPTNPSGGVCIHHPHGDAKKFSKEEHEVVHGSFAKEGYIANKHWKISHWEKGTTENGSSGAPLFDINNHLLVGMLTGGLADCVEPNDDYFAQLYKVWNVYDKCSARLDCWLLPNGESRLHCPPLDAWVDIPEYLHEGIDIYPNPIENTLFISTSDEWNEEPLTIYIYNNNGVLVYIEEFNENKSNLLEIDCSELAYGTYSILLTGKKKKYVHQFVKK